jgi:VanZ family protein
MVVLSWQERFAWALTVTLSIAMIWAFLTPLAALPRVPKISDYLWHIGLFAILVIPLGTTFPARRTSLVVFAICFGALLEILQPYFGRGFEVHDLFANLIGVTLGWLISRKLAAIIIRH